MLPEEDLRKAYLQLMTSFIMEDRQRLPDRFESDTGIRSIDRVKYLISPPATNRIQLSAAGAQIYTMLKPGMTESQVLQLGNRICLERGFVMISDTCRKLYMHLDRNAQIWVELTQNNIDEEAVVTDKSSIELKSTWKIYTNNILKVSQE